MSTPSAPSQEPLLRLDTLIERPSIEIDGARYEILTPDELSVLDTHRIGQMGRRIEELAKDESPEASAEQQELVTRLSRQVAVGVPDEIFDTLTGAHRWAIVDVFTALLLGSRLGVAGAMEKAMGLASSTGGIASPGSSGSTAATPDGGWLKRLLRWCGLI